MDENIGAAGPETAHAPAPGVLNMTGWRGKPFLRLPKFNRRDRLLLAAFVAAAWLASGIFIVGPDEVGVVLQFGRWASTDSPGLHYHLPYPMGSVFLPKVTMVNELRSDSLQGPGTAAGMTGAPTPAVVASASRMLTGDENIVEADYSVLWKIKDARAFLFHVQQPEAVIGMAAEAAIRAVIGRNPIQAALSDRRQQIAAEAQDELQHLLDSYDAGVFVIRVQLQRVDPPAAVIDAFNDVQRARADQVRARNEAEAYRNDILPRARGQADRIQQEAEAYRTQVVDQAKGEASAFLSAYDTYRQSPAVFASRTYFDSMDELLRHASRVVVDASGKELSSVVPYMPLGEPPARRLPDPPPPSAAATAPSSYSSSSASSASSAVPASGSSIWPEARQ